MWCFPELRYPGLLTTVQRKRGNAAKDSGSDKRKNYVPIAPARRLAGIDSNIIGLFVLDIDISESKSRVSESTYFSRLINLIIDQANNFGFQVLVSIITSQKQLSEIRNLFMSRTFSAAFLSVRSMMKSNLMMIL